MKSINSIRIIQRKNGLPIDSTSRNFLCFTELRSGLLRLLPRIQSYVSKEATEEKFQMLDVENICKVLAYKMDQGELVGGKEIAS